MKSRNIILVLLITFLVFFVIYLTGILHFRFPTSDEIRTAVSSSTDTEKDYNRGTFLDLKKNYGIFEKDVEEFVYFSPLSSMDASELLIVKFKNSQLANKYKKSVDDRVTKRYDMYRSYRPEEAELLSKSITQIRGNYLIFVASRDIDKIKASLAEVFK